MSEGKVMYRTWLRDIEKFTVVRETESTVFFINDRGKNDSQRRVSSGVRWHDSFEQAVAFLIQVETGKIAGFKLNIARSESEIERLKSLKDN